MNDGISAGIECRGLRTHLHKCAECPLPSAGLASEDERYARVQIRSVSSLCCISTLICQPGTAARVSERMRFAATSSHRRALVYRHRLLCSDMCSDRSSRLPHAIMFLTCSSLTSAKKSLTLAEHKLCIHVGTTNNNINNVSVFFGHFSSRVS